MVFVEFSSHVPLTRFSAGPGFGVVPFQNFG